MILSELGISQCMSCGNLVTVDAPCHNCAIPPAYPTRCPGWACPLQATCSKYTDPNSQGTTNVRWTEPPYDPITGTCEDHS